jgi:hypothetical protein
MKKNNCLVTRREILLRIPSKREVQRLLAGKWLVPCRPGPYALFDPHDVDRVVSRLQRGELPPLLKCELQMGRRRIQSRKPATRRAKCFRVK